MNVYDLGLIYGVQVQEPGKVDIAMTLTTPHCPAARHIPELIRARVGTLPGVQEVNIDIVWEPKWNPAMISPEGRKVLKLED